MISIAPPWSFTVKWMKSFPLGMAKSFIEDCPSQKPFSQSEMPRITISAKSEVRNTNLRYVIFSANSFKIDIPLFS